MVAPMVRSSTCRRCNRRLRDDLSRSRGIGAVCEKREAWEKGFEVPSRYRRRALQAGPDLFEAMQEEYRDAREGASNSGAGFAIATEEVEGEHSVESR